ncbi:response regulator [Hydrogenovibrio kuenenii]|uniref:response regulator n=1 Tax=Hydrogenovibrio kuenenii TaxID=63658 RepID=UPI0004672113|nr:response regulator [Hydrogenovibrio kuenenii]
MDKLSWIQGRKIALCEPDAERAQTLKKLLDRLGLEVAIFSTPDEVLSEIERHRYTTYRMYLIILIDLKLAMSVESKWIAVTNGNPGILQTPVTLMYEAKDAALAKTLMKNGYVRFELQQPVAEDALKRLLILLNRWKGRQHLLAKSASAPAKLSR